MKLIPLINRTGAVRAWADRKTGWICNPSGNCFALIEFDGVFRLTGEQIGWFYGDVVRERHGRVVLARPGAKIEGLTMPRLEKITKPPQISLPTGRPVLRWLLPPPMKQHAWAEFKTLFDDGLDRVRAFEKKLRKSQQKAYRSIIVGTAVKPMARPSSRKARRCDAERVKDPPARKAGKPFSDVSVSCSKLRASDRHPRR